MPIDTNLFLNLTTERFVQSYLQPSDIGKPSWYYKDIKNLRVQFFRNSAAGQGQVEVVPAAGVSLQVGLATIQGGTVLSSATADPADANNTYTVSLPLNITSIGTALGAATERDFILEFLTSDGTSPQRYQAQVRIRRGVLSGTDVDPETPELGATLDQINALYWPRVAEAGAFQIWTSPNGSQWAESITDAGTKQLIQLS